MKNLFVSLVLVTLGVVSAAAQRPALTADDYARAEKVLSYNTDPLVDRNGVRATWLADGRFWYRVLTPTGSEYVLINPADGSRKTAATINELGVTGNPGNADTRRPPRWQRRSRDLAGRDKVGVHSRLQSLDQGHRDREGNAAYDRRCQELRLCDRQCWLGP